MWSLSFESILTPPQQCQAVRGPQHLELLTIPRPHRLPKYFPQTLDIHAENMFHIFCGGLLHFLAVFYPDVPDSPCCPESFPSFSCYDDTKGYFLMHLMHKATLALASALLLCLALSSHVQAQTTLYGQPAYLLGDYRWNSYYSSGPTTIYDNFTLTSASQLGTVNWQGLTVAGDILGYSHPGVNPDGLGHQGVEPSTFTINFYSDNAGTPGALINSQTVSPTRTFVANGDLFDDGALINIYSYSAPLVPTPVLQGNTKYWISIVGNVTGGTAWGWDSGQPGDGGHYETNATNSSWTGFFGYDRAFSLGAPAPVPEASSFVSLGLLLLLGLGSVAVSRRRKAGAAP